jgi:transposase
MSRFFDYAPDQAFLLPPNVKDVLGEQHLCFHVHRLVEAFDVSQFEQAYAAEGRLAYPPAMMLKVWLYAYLLGVHSTRRLEQRVREDLAFRYLAGGLQPDHKTLSEFLRRHGRAINDLFTQTIELGRRAGLVRLGHVAIDSTRVQANAARHRMVDAEPAARQQRARDRRRVRQFQQRALAPEPDEGAGGSLATAAAEKLEQQLATAGEGLAKLPKGKRRQVSATDPDSRFLRTRQGWVLGYTGEVAVSDDHFIVAARVTQNASDNASLLPLLDEVERRSRCRPEKATADSGFFSGEAVRECGRRGIDVYMPDNNLRHEMSSGKPAKGIGRCTIRDPQHLLLREKLRSPAGRKFYQRRQAVVEPVIGILKEQRGMRRFRRRGLERVNTEWIMAVIAYNLGRLRCR